jgi:hypothetical protein
LLGLLRVGLLLLRLLRGSFRFWRILTLLSFMTVLTGFLWVRQLLMLSIWLLLVGLVVGVKLVEEAVLGDTGAMFLGSPLVVGQALRLPYRWMLVLILWLLGLVGLRSLQLIQGLPVTLQFLPRLPRLVEVGVARMGPSICFLWAVALVVVDPLAHLEGWARLGRVSLVGQETGQALILPVVVEGLAQWGRALLAVARMAVTAVQVFLLRSRVLLLGVPVEVEGLSSLELPEGQLTEVEPELLVQRLQVEL